MTAKDVGLITYKPSIPFFFKKKKEKKRKEKENKEKASIYEVKVSRCCSP
jgi:hypothetical protein